MRKLNPHGRKAVIYASCCACFSGWPILLRGHKFLMLLPIAFQVFMLTMAIVELRKSKEASA